jgi:hypothetical protein
MGRRRNAVLALAVGAVALPAGAAIAAPSDLPAVASGPRPGPDALYAPPAEAPQLENAPPWQADPLLVSGASAYRGGEFLYQDFLFDDHGALGVKDPADKHDVGGFLFSPKAGTLTYPTDPVYAENAADLVELRVKPLGDAIAFRVTLNSLKDPARTAFTIALGTSDQARDWPHGAGVSSPAQRFLTVHGDQAELTDAATGQAVAPAPTAAVDLRRRQVDVRVPRAAFDPGTSTVRMAAGVGLWEVAAGAYAAPAIQASASEPGGASPTGAALFNLAFRYAEPLPDVTQFGAGVTIADAGVGASVDAAWWREKSQASALLTGDVSPFFADVDFGKLAARTDDDARVPKTGPISRIFASRYVFGQGVDFGQLCGGLLGDVPGCVGANVGQLQPYGLYVPKKPQPQSGWGLTLLLHSLSANYNQYMGSRNQSQLGDRGPGSLVATPQGRGPDGSYTDIAEGDTFEVWADVARHYNLDPDWATVSGYSMGGYGTFRLAARWPDLFARGASVVGAGSPNATLGSLRNVPIMHWAATADELVNINSTETTGNLLNSLGLRYVHDLFLAADHLTLATNDEYGPVAEFLGTHRVDRSPARVTFVVAPGSDSARAGAVADHAYWLSGLRLRSPAVGQGTIDARSAAFGTGDPPVIEPVPTPGLLQGGERGPTPFVRREQSWGKAPETPKADRLEVTATNVAAAEVDARRARLSCAPEVALRSDGPLDLRIACPARRRRCATRLRLALPKVKGRRIVAVTVTRKGKRVTRVRGRNLRRVTIKRPGRKAFVVRIRATSSGRPARTVTVVRRVSACR